MKLLNIFKKKPLQTKVDLTVNPEKGLVVTVFQENKVRIQVVMSDKKELVLFSKELLSYIEQEAINGK